MPRAAAEGGVGLLAALEFSAAHNHGLSVPGQRRYGAER